MYHGYLSVAEWRERITTMLGNRDLVADGDAVTLGIVERDSRRDRRRRRAVPAQRRAPRRRDRLRTEPARPRPRIRLRGGARHARVRLRRGRPAPHRRPPRCPQRPVRHGPRTARHAPGGATSSATSTSRTSGPTRSSTPCSEDDVARFDDLNRLRQARRPGRRAGPRRSRCRPTAAPGRRGPRAAEPATLACVIRPGCSISDSTPPSDSPRVNTAVSPQTLSAASSPPRIRNETMPPNPRICRRRCRAPGARAGPGRAPSDTAGARVRKSTTRAALSQCRSIRTPSVLMPRSTSQASNGPATAPIAFWWNASSRPRSASATTSAPPTTSECPPRYFVVECTTTSAPSASGCCRYGEANVLSTTSSAPAGRRRSRRARRCRRCRAAGWSASRTRSPGSSGGPRRAPPPRSASGTEVYSTPQFVSTRATSRNVPP